MSFFFCVETTKMYRCVDDVPKYRKLILTEKEREREREREYGRKKEEES